jgi:hypothetical protein
MYNENEALREGKEGGIISERSSNEKALIEIYTSLNCKLILRFLEASFLLQGGYI